VVVEVHPHPEQAWSDGAKSLTFEGFGDMMQALQQPLRAISEGTAVAHTT
jgi:3-deoxy-D-arabino-heptulosonate 7-phosphate (DAHP) synthase